MLKFVSFTNGQTKRELRGIEEQRKMMRGEAGEVRRRRRRRNLTSTTDQVHVIILL